MVKMAEETVKREGRKCYSIQCVYRLFGQNINLHFTQTRSTFSSCSGINDEIKMLLSSVVQRSDKKKRNKKRQTPIFSDSAS